MNKDQATASLVAKKLKGEGGINNMSRAELLSVPFRGSFSTPVICNSIILVPCKGNHDSGYRLMNFIAVKDGWPICTLSGCSDVLNIDGIGGYGTGRGWSIDCLSKSGLMHLWISGHMIQVGSALSSFEIFAVKRRKP